MNILNKTLVFGVKHFNQNSFHLNARHLITTQFKDWLSPFTGDPYSAFCRTCHCKLHAHKKGLLAHAKSSKHRKHTLTGEDPLSTESGEIVALKKLKKTHFNDQWLEDTNFSQWLRKIPNNSTKALCVACRSVITAGRSELIKHSQAAKHKKAILDGIPEDIGEIDIDWLDPSYVPQINNNSNNNNNNLTVTPALTFSTNITVQQINSNNHIMDTLGLNLSDIISQLQESVPLHLAEKWDNVGLLSQPTQPTKIHNILLTIDLTEKVVEEALKKRVNLIISYHPPIFKPLKSLSPNVWKEKIILTCIENKIAIYSPHTVLDAIKGGINDWLLTAFGSSLSSPIQQSYSDQSGSGHFSNCLDVLVSEGEDVTQALSGLENVILTVKSNEYGGCDVRVCCDDKTLPKVVDILSQHPVAQLCSRITKLQTPPLPGQGMGRFACLDQSLPLYEIVHRIKQHLDLTHVRLAISPKHTRDTKVNTIAVCAGSGASVLRGCKADVWITGEMSHHEVLDAIHYGSSVILCEHTNTERGYLKPWAEQLKDNLGQHNVNIMISDVDKDPLKVV
ncbi:NIF3-like protein 1 isoform X2 [Oppia nitens]|uniref:NIF3-like protein 1 isoform X2 n=1 Tax=Oppia nitens TaxID=1686743 RepID=UPI0023DCB605|nr:NIF3-like protein 1 isoform X2 [Oppia nitens]